MNGRGLGSSAQERPRETGDRGAVEEGDHPLAQEHRGPSAFGDFQKRQCDAAFLDARRTGTGS